MDALSFFFKEWTYNFNRPPAARKDFAAGQAHRLICWVTPGELEKLIFGQGENHPANAAPMDGAGAHRAWLGAGVQRAAR
jgi:hypothetical protein